MVLGDPALCVGTDVAFLHVGPFHDVAAVDFHGGGVVRGVGGARDPRTRLWPDPADASCAPGGAAGRPWVSDPLRVWLAYHSSDAVFIGVWGAAASDSGRSRPGGVSGGDGPMARAQFPGQRDTLWDSNLCGF